jgi:hypothetical protein
LIFAFGAAVCAWYVAWSMRQLQRARQQPPAIESDTVSHLRAKN